MNSKSAKYIEHLAAAGIKILDLTVDESDTTKAYLKAKSKLKERIGFQAAEYPEDLKQSAFDRKKLEEKEPENRYKDYNTQVKAYNKALQENLEGFALLDQLDKLFEQLERARNTNYTSSGALTKDKTLTDELDKIDDYKTRLGLKRAVELPNTKETTDSFDDLHMFSAISALVDECIVGLTRLEKQRKKCEEALAQSESPHQTPEEQPLEGEPVDLPAIEQFTLSIKKITLNKFNQGPAKKRLTATQHDTLQKYGEQTLYGLVTDLLDEKKEKIAQEKSEYSLSYLFSQIFESGADDKSLSTVKYEYLTAVRDFIENPTDKTLSTMKLARVTYDETKYQQDPLSAAYRQFKETVGLDEERVEVISVLMDEIVDRYQKLPKQELSNTSPANK